MNAIHKLHRLSRKFGKGPALSKLRLLQRIARMPTPGRRDLQLLGETLDFQRAYERVSRPLDLAFAVCEPRGV